MITLKNYFKCIESISDNAEVIEISKKAIEHMQIREMTGLIHMPLSEMFNTMQSLASICSKDEHWKRIATVGHDYITDNKLDNN